MITDVLPTASVAARTRDAPAPDLQFAHSHVCAQRDCRLQLGSCDPFVSYRWYQNITLIDNESSVVVGLPSSLFLLLCSIHMTVIILKFWQFFHGRSSLSRALGGPPSIQWLFQTFCGC